MGGQPIKPSKWRCLLEDVNLNQVSEIKEAKRQMGLSNNIPQLRGGQVMITGM